MGWTETRHEGTQWDNPAEWCAPKTGTIRTTPNPWNGHYPIPLEEHNHNVATFLTPWGRYQPHNLPQRPLTADNAYTAAPDGNKESKTEDPPDTHNGTPEQRPWTTQNKSPHNHEAEDTTKINGTPSPQDSQRTNDSTTPHTKCRKT